MPFSRPLKALILISLFALGACDAFNQQGQNNAGNPPRVGSLTQNLNMVDATGRIYGTVILDPINGGKLFDSEGRLIGRIVNPVPAPLAPTVQ